MSFDLSALCDAVARHGHLVRIVVASTAGSTPREAGASMMIWQSGQSGTIGGGALEFQAVERARMMLQTGMRAQLDQVPLGPGLGQCCGGAVTLLSEVFDEKRLGDLKGSDVFARAVSDSADPPLAVTRILAKARAQGVAPTPELSHGWMIEPVCPTAQPLWIYGAGHVGRALVTTLSPLPDFAITWVDTGPDRFPDHLPDGVTALPSPHPDTAAPLAPDNAHHLILTYSHALDLELCHRILGRPHGGIGLIGSATKWARFRNRLRQLGHAPDQINRITCPIGRPSLGKHPQAVAVGVAAALLNDMVQNKTNRGTPSDGDTGHRRRSAQP